MLKTKLFGCALGVSVVLGFLAPVQAYADQAEDAIKYRQSIFTAIRWHFAPMGAMLRGKMPYDAAQFKHHADQLAALTHMPAEGFMVAGSDFGDTKAKAELWDNMDDVRSRFDTLISNSAALATAAGGEMDAVKVPFGAVAKTCKGCHENYREE